MTHLEIMHTIPGEMHLDQAQKIFEIVMRHHLTVQELKAIIGAVQSIYQVEE